MMDRTGVEHAEGTANTARLRSGGGHILISGTGRSGTTLLMQILTCLNFDTGFSRDEALGGVDEISRAGLEWRLNAPDLPYVAKSPIFADHIAGALERGLKVEAAIIPVRELFQAAESRRHVYRQVESLGREPLKHPGGLWKTAVPSDQEDALARQFNRLLEPLVLWEVPLFFLSFPRFAQDAEYFYRCLEPLFTKFSISRDEVVRVHSEIVDLSLITDFSGGPPPPAPLQSLPQISSPGGDVEKEYASTAPQEVGLGTYLSSVSFWWPDYLEPSAWIEHAPFAFWLIEAQRPRTLVELGTQLGYSYFAFCQAVKRLGLATRCHAVDTWRGDEHAGFYGDGVFQRVSDYNQRHYGDFSDLVRATFEEALPQFEDGSIDILHVDGRHFYEDVKNDFESWKPKLSERSVVLFHDTNVRERDFGVFRLWAELKDRYPSFEFYHGYGLGVLGHGAELPPAIHGFFAQTAEPSRAAQVRAAYQRLGAAPKADFDSRRALAKLAARAKRDERNLLSQASKLQNLERIAKELRAKESEKAAKLEVRRAEVRMLSAKLRRLEARLAGREPSSITPALDSESLSGELAQVGGHSASDREAEGS